MKLKYTTITLIILVVGIFFIYKQQNDNSLYSTLKKEGFNLELINDFQINKDNLKENPYKSRIILAKNDNLPAGGETIKLKLLYDMNQEKAEEYIDDQKVILTSLYEPIPPPYPEFIGQEVSCDEKYKPILKEHELGEYYLLYAGERFGYGICEEEMVKHKSLLGYFYCDNKLIKLEYFIDKNQNFDLVEKIIKDLKCI
ncbi:hypothetical protein HOD96_02340 [Candidatus Falkowbacteria bacterium]|jgi:hypothetical protein|nr:hypothetical protein [Candidatus Falkowbacteria bacterium]MBT4433454.1 hypothetical protein [Candidatus Falkowbacteria bacterium]